MGLSDGHVHTHQQAFYTSRQMLHLCSVRLLLYFASNPSLDYDVLKHLPFFSPYLALLHKETINTHLSRNNPAVSRCFLGKRNQCSTA